MSGMSNIVQALSVPVGAGTGDGSSAVNAGASALAIKRRTGTTTDGLYWIKAPNGTAAQVWCDMNTAGGGWMLVARTHPSGTGLAGGVWGWTTTSGTGSVTNFSAPYCLDIGTWYNNGFRFSSYIFGNQYSNNSNTWGPFIYQVNLYDQTTLQSNNVQWSAESYLTLKTDTNVYWTTGFPSMQTYIGYQQTATSYNVFFMRDCCSPGGPGEYGLNPWGMITTYCSNPTILGYCGPWCNGATLNGNLYVQGGSNSQTNTGGTNQCMLMVR